MITLVRRFARITPVALLAIASGCPTSGGKASKVTVTVVFGDTKCPLADISLDDKSISAKNSGGAVATVDVTAHVKVTCAGTGEFAGKRVPVPGVTLKLSGPGSTYFKWADFPDIGPTDANGVADKSFTGRGSAVDLTGKSVTFQIVDSSGTAVADPGGGVTVQQAP